MSITFHSAFDSPAGKMSRAVLWRLMFASLTLFWAGVGFAIWAAI